jgi:hypothetical protein
MSLDLYFGQGDESDDAKGPEANFLGPFIGEV